MWLLAFSAIVGLVVSSPAPAAPAVAAYDRPSPYTVPEAPPVCDALVCVHYVTTTDDAVSLTDGNANGVPDQPEVVLASFQRAWRVLFGRLGFATPPPDQGAGGDDRYDVYLENRTGAVTVPEIDLPGGNSTSRIYLASTMGAHEVPSVAAHELGHAAQFALSSDSIGQRFFDESMATWLQEEVVPGSARDLVGAGQFATPDLPLDYNVAVGELGWDHQVYAQWIFFDYLADRFGTKVIRQMLEASRPPGVWEVAAMDSALRRHKSSLARAYVGFTRAILDPRRSFGFKKKVPYQAFADLKPGKRVSRSVRLDHLSHWRYSVKGRPSSRVGRLHVKVKTPRGFSGGVVVSVLRGRKPPKHTTLKRSRAGVARGTVPLGGRQARSVMITLVNSSWKPSACNRGTRFTCGGVFADDGTKVRVRVRWLPR
jgi:hypothetical protein